MVYQSLNNFLSLHFNFPHEYKITYRTPVDNTEKTITLPAVSYDKVNIDGASKEPLSYKVLENKHTALMGIHSFNYYRKDSVRFFQTVNDFFSQVQSQGIENLILDLRGNSGGDPFCAAHLLSYLESKPFVYYADNYDWCPQLSKLYQPKSKSFKGNLFVLTDGLCFSTTSHLGSLMKVNKVGTLVGDEMGGTYTCNDSGKWFDLKKSGLRLRMARQSFRTTATSLPREHGVMPDHLVKANSKEIIDGRDAVMEYTLKIIEK